MRVVTVTNDVTIFEEIRSLERDPFWIFDHYKGSNDSLEVFSFIQSKHTGLVILDEDFICEDSGRIIELLKKMNPDLKIIFLTSDSSLELGRAISPLGIHFYGIKPLLAGVLREAITCLPKNNKSQFNLV